MIIRNHMSAPPITVAPDTDFKVAMALMQRHRIRRLPVIEADGTLVGIVAERDLLGAADRYLQSIADVGEVMTRDVVTVARSTPITEAASRMIELKIGGLPVVDASKKVLGIITETDLLKALVGILTDTRSEPGAARAAAGGNAGKTKAAVGKTGPGRMRKAAKSKRQAGKSSRKGRAKAP